MLTTSVVIPTYNRARLLDRALDSVLRQTRPADEIIVVDDGSTDYTARFLSINYPDIIYLRQPYRKGVSAARNAGISRARGKWIAFLDSDDEWLPDKLNKQLACLDDNRGYRIIHCNEIWIRNGIRVNQMKKHRKYGGAIFPFCLSRCVISPSSVIIDFSIFEELGLFDEDLVACEDYDMWLRICSRMPVLFLDEPLVYKYGGHSDQLSRQFTGMDRFRIHALDKILESGTLHNGYYNAAADSLVEKAEIFLNGARKRGNLEQANAIEVIAGKYRNHGPLVKNG